MVRKFIIDTDTGVDDAMALLMALAAHLKGEVSSQCLEYLECLPNTSGLD